MKDQVIVLGIVMSNHNQEIKVKSLLLSAMLFSSAICFAGPEDHVQAQTCYSIKEQDLNSVSEFAPKEICFEELSINTNNDQIYVYSYFSHFQKYLKELRLTSLIRQTEDSFSYEAENVFFEQKERHCEDGIKLTLKFKGNVDFMGQGNIEDQKLSLVQETKADVCHSRAEVSVFNYIRTR